LNGWIVTNVAPLRSVGRQLSAWTWHAGLHWRSEKNGKTNPKKLAESTFDEMEQLLRIDRYERRALSVGERRSARMTQLRTKSPSTLRNLAKRSQNDE
jgi:hypothetical protein